MNFQGSTHSELVQRKINKARHADREFATISSNDSSKIPIVLVPRSSRLFSFALNVPSGPFILYQRWYEDKGELKPGVIWVWPFWYRISHIVTKSVISYNAPAQNCPTADNIMVNV
jgi:regulator of protease activity HflC (stomatin/prohibitin superfamily)